MADRLDKSNKISTAEILKRASELRDLRRDMLKLKTETAEVRGRIAGVYRSVKASGGSKEILDEAITIIDRDEDEHNDYMAELHRYTSAMGRPLWTGPTTDQPQGAMFPDDPVTDEMRAQERASRMMTLGYEARIGQAERGDKEALFEPGSADWDSWDRGWLQADGELSGRTPPPKRAVGRPKKAKAEEPEPTADTIGETAGSA